MCQIIRRQEIIETRCLSVKWAVLAVSRNGCQKLPYKLEVMGSLMESQIGQEAMRMPIPASNSVNP